MCSRPLLLLKIEDCLFEIGAKIDMLGANLIKKFEKREVVKIVGFPGVFSVVFATSGFTAIVHSPGCQLNDTVLCSRCRGLGVSAYPPKASKLQNSKLAFLLRVFSC
jgi:hypothetical protein